MSVIVIGPNPLLQIGQKTIVIGRIRSRPQQILKGPRNIIKVGLPTQFEKSAPTDIKGTQKYNKGGFTHPV
jgi:hypothetical protein